MCCGVAYTRLLTLFLFSLQTKHHTHTEKDFKLALETRGARGLTLYPFKESKVHDMKVSNVADFSLVESPEGFVNVWNSGTPEYDEVLADLVDSIPWL